MTARESHPVPRRRDFAIRFLAIVVAIVAIGAVSALWIMQSAGLLCLTDALTTDGHCAVAQPFTSYVTIALVSMILLLLVALLILRKRARTVATTVALVGLAVALLWLGIGLTGPVAI
jgi:hypothetical protein